MRKIVLVLSLNYLGSVSAMDIPAPPEVINVTDQIAIPQLKAIENFQEIQKLYTTYTTDPSSTLRLEITHGLNSLMQRNTLTNDDANNAEPIAKTLKASSLLMRLQTLKSDYKESLGDLERFPQEIVSLILDMVIEDAKPYEILKLLRISKEFNKQLLNAQVSLDLSPHKDKVTNAVISTIVSIFPHLKELNLEGSLITNDGLAPLNFLVYLHSLNLQKCNNITPVGLAFLAPLTQLLSLNLAYCGEITYELTHLEPLTQLQSLNLKGCWIDETVLAQVTSFTQLRSLNLGYGYNTTDTQLQHLTSLTPLESLNLSHSPNITKEGLDHLTSLKQLHLLNLKDCKNITGMAINEFKRKLPNTKIVR